MMTISEISQAKTKFSESIDFTAYGAGKARFFEMKQKVEIMFEVEETIILRQGEKMFTEFCPQCRAMVEMLTPQSAAALFNLTEREIFRLIESGRLHFVEAERIFVCRNSLTVFNQPERGSGFDQRL